MSQQSQRRNIPPSLASARTGSPTWVCTSSNGMFKVLMASLLLHESHCQLLGHPSASHQVSALTKMGNGVRAEKDSCRWLVQKCCLKTHERGYKCVDLQIRIHQEKLAAKESSTKECVSDSILPPHRFVLCRLTASKRDPTVQYGLKMNALTLISCIQNLQHGYLQLQEDESISLLQRKSLCERRESIVVVNRG